ncbi:MAG: glycosyltransferase family 4 protein [Acidobacteriota bacterium]
MRILQISSAKNFGGGEKHLVDLSKGLVNYGNEIFAALRPKNNWQEKLAFLPDENLCHPQLRNSFDVFSARKLANFAVEKNIEIIHAHVARDYSVAALASKLSKIPLVLTRHLLFPLNPIHRLTLKQTAKIIAVSKGVGESLLSSKIVAVKKIALIYNGVDTNNFEQAAKDAEKRAETRRKIAPEARFLIGTIGELRQHKGQEDFIKAAAIVVEKFQDVRFLVIGADNSQNQNYQTYLENLVDNLNLKNQVTFTGWQENMPTTFAALDIFVSAARSEPFGLVIAEAMAGAKAIVATETNGAKELLENNRTGKIVSVKKPLQLAEAISEFLEDENLRQTYGASAQKEAIEKFGLERMTAETEKIYREILEI